MGTATEEAAFFGGPFFFLGPPPLPLTGPAGAAAGAGAGAAGAGTDTPGACVALGCHLADILVSFQPHALYRRRVRCHCRRVCCRRRGRGRLCSCHARCCRLVFAVWGLWCLWEGFCVVWRCDERSSGQMRERERVRQRQKEREEGKVKEKSPSLSFSSHCLPNITRLLVSPLSALVVGGFVFVLRPLRRRAKKKDREVAHERTSPSPPEGEAR